jgi:hypothetical protein
MPASAPTLQLVRNGGADSLIFRTNGSGVPILTDSIVGRVDILEEQNDMLHIACWAADTRRAVPADAILLVVDGVVVKTLTPNFERPDLVKGFKNKGLLRSGIDSWIPRSSLGRLDMHSNVQFFAVGRFGSVASELSYSKDYRYRHEAGSER